MARQRTGCHMMPELAVKQNITVEIKHMQELDALVKWKNWFVIC
jgi:hypothetical protein